MTIPIQLAIQGGGARITHLLAALEAVQSLQRQGVLRVTRIAGTSAGAIAGALFAAGIDMPRARDAFEAHRDELLHAFPPTGFRLRSAWCLLTRHPYWDAAPLRRLLAKLLAPRHRLGDLEIPLVVVAADLTNMQSCVYEDPHDPLISSLMDSAGIPFFLRTAHNVGGYRVVVDGGVCENLPSDQLSYSEEDGEVLGITFCSSRAGAPLSGFFDFARALIETALNASVLRAQLELGPNNFVIRTEAGSFDFARAFDAGLGAEYRETRLLSDDFFRRYAERPRELLPAGEEDLEEAGAELPAMRLHDVVTALRSMYRLQQEPMRFEFLAVRMVVTGASQSPDDLPAPDHVRHEIVFRATQHAVSCYRIRLMSAGPATQPKTQCEVFDRNFEPVAFDLVPITGDASEEREYLLFFREPIVPGDERAPVTLRVRDTVPEALRLASEGRDELLTRASRADGPVGRIEIVVHLPEELANAAIAAAPGSGGARMTPAELMHYAAPAGFVTLGWKGDHVPPNTLFGCHLVKR
jgi:predicted acylesterase/phospholipase RssA